MYEKQLLEAMQRFDTKITENKSYLSDLDTPIGDGDHGNNMARGMTAVSEGLSKLEDADATTILKTVAMQLLSKVGGASGPLYGSAFLAMSKNVEKLDNFVDVLETGLEAIQARGKSERNDKTMIDVWAPLLEIAHTRSLTQEDIDSTVEATREILAKKGRASYLGERSVGHIDPGAASSGLLFESLMEVGLI